MDKFPNGFGPATFLRYEGCLSFPTHVRNMGSVSSPPSATSNSLDTLIADPTLEEVWTNGPDQVFVAEGGVSRAFPISLSAMQIRGFVERVLRQTGGRVDVSSPLVDASLSDGSRLHVVIPDITKPH